MKELVVISGKGGTGKTSIVASFAALSKNTVLADCDVDAADLHLILEPSETGKRPFAGGKRASVIPDNCTACGRCEEVCRFGAVHLNGSDNTYGDRTYTIDPYSCEGCGICKFVCPSAAIDFDENQSGEWFVSKTRFGPMVHARLFPGEENSGKLVTLVRNQARLIAERDEIDMILVDGSPGIGCPVIASITGADLVLVITEPTLSGKHDLERVCELTRHFNIATVVCINKHDINEALTEKIAEDASRVGSKVIGKVRYDPAVTKAQLMKSSVVEYTGGSVGQDIRRLWDRVSYELG